MTLPHVSNLELSDEVLARILQDHTYRALFLDIADDAIDANIKDPSSFLKLAEGDEVLALIAARLVESKNAVLSIKGNRKIGIVFGMWKELARIQPKRSDNPHGENFLVDKLKSLSWLFEGSTINWHLYVVDDGCPQQSGEAARDIAAKSKWRDKVSVLELSEHLQSTDFPLNKLSKVEDSIKGGAVILGCVKAIEDGCNLVCYTDADNSTHLSQLGRLIVRIETGEADVVVGSRWLDNPYSWWHKSRGTEQPGSRIFRHMRGLLSLKLPVEDVFCPLKVFRSEVLARILPGVTRFDFGFDLDLMAQVAKFEVPVVSIGILYFDSVLETTWTNFGDASVWFQKLDSMARNAQMLELQHDSSISSAIIKYLKSPKEVEFLFGVEPPQALINCGLNDLGKQEVMRSEEVILFLQASFDHRRLALGSVEIQDFQVN
jgi:hypothetical protein